MWYRKSITHFLPQRLIPVRFASSPLLPHQDENLWILAQQADNNLRDNNYEGHRAISGFIGNYGTTPEENAGGLWNYNDLEDALGNQQKLYSSEAAHHIQHQFNPVKQHLQNNYGDTIRLYRN